MFNAFKGLVGGGGGGSAAGGGGKVQQQPQPQARPVQSMNDLEVVRRQLDSALLEASYDAMTVTFVRSAH